MTFYFIKLFATQSLAIKTTDHMQCGYCSNSRATISCIIEVYIQVMKLLDHLTNLIKIDILLEIN